MLKPRDLQALYIILCIKVALVTDAKLPDSIQTHEGVTGQKAA